MMAFERPSHPNSDRKGLARGLERSSCSGAPRVVRLLCLPGQPCSRLFDWSSSLAHCACSLWAQPGRVDLPARSNRTHGGLPDETLGARRVFTPLEVQTVMAARTSARLTLLDSLLSSCVISRRAYRKVATTDRRCSTGSTHARRGHPTALAFREVGHVAPLACRFLQARFRSTHLDANSNWRMNFKFIDCIVVAGHVKTTSQGAPRASSPRSTSRAVGTSCPRARRHAALWASNGKATGVVACRRNFQQKHARHLSGASGSIEHTNSGGSIRTRSRWQRARRC